MSLPHNFTRFPENIEPPETKIIDGKTYRVHGFHFRGLQDLYTFLKKNPRINLDTFAARGIYASSAYDHKPELTIASVAGPTSFAGVPYEQAVENLIIDNDPGYQEYLKIQKELHLKDEYVHKYNKMKTIAGGAVDPVAYTTGSPKIYTASRLAKKTRFITISTQVSYNCRTTKEQVFNRALIITNLIKALETNGYNVDINSFMLAKESDEIIKAVFEIKRHGERVNYQALYKTLVNVEFFRRLCFRLMEVSDVENFWVDGYGLPVDKDLAKKLLRLGKDDIYFDQPRDMKIRGDNIEDDFENAIKCLNLQNVIDINKEKKLLKQSITRSQNNK